MTGKPRELSPAEIVDVSEKLAHIASEANIDPAKTLMKLGLSTADFKLDDKASSVWLDIVRRIHAGASQEAGYRADATARLIEKVAAQAKGNTELSELAFQIGQGVRQSATSVHSIFLSYATANRVVVDQLYDAIHKANSSLMNQPYEMIFQDHCSLAPGQDWLNVLRERAGSASLLVCWVTSDYLKSAFCNYEIGVAESRGAKIVPLFVESSTVDQIPAYLSRFQGIQVGDPPDFRELAGRILVLLN